MNIKQIVLSLCIVFGALHTPSSAFAAPSEAGSAGVLASSFAPLLVDKRVVHLEAFFRTYNSPLEKHAVTFIREADKHNMDWRFVAAIAGVESTFGKRIPPGSYNAWGWGIPTGAQSGIGFDSWDDGISTVTAGLKKNYINKGAVTFAQIGRIYAASPTWASKVEYFMDKITNFVPKDADHLDITI